MCFVTVMHEYSSAGKLVVRERQDVVYRDAPSKTGAETGGAAEPRDRAPVGEATRQVTADATMLFLSIRPPPSMGTESTMTRPMPGRSKDMGGLSSMGRFRQP